VEQVVEGDLLAALAAPTGSHMLVKLHRCTCQILP
jgi:hypothetical protein